LKTHRLKSKAKGRKQKANSAFQYKKNIALGKSKVRSADIGGHLEEAEVVVAQRATQDH